MSASRDVRTDPCERVHLLPSHENNIGLSNGAVQASPASEHLRQGVRSAIGRLESTLRANKSPKFFRLLPINAIGADGRAGDAAAAAGACAGTFGQAVEDGPPSPLGLRRGSLHSLRERRLGWPGRTRTSNQTVMSGSRSRESPVNPDETDDDR